MGLLPGGSISVGRGHAGQAGCCLYKPFAESVSACLDFDAWLLGKAPFIVHGIGPVSPVVVSSNGWCVLCSADRQAHILGLYEAVGAQYANRRNGFYPAIRVNMPVQLYVHSWRLR